MMVTKIVKNYKPTAKTSSLAGRKDLMEKDSILDTDDPMHLDFLRKTVNFD